MENNRVFRPGQSGGPSSTFNITIPLDKDIYISDSDSDEPCSDKPCADTPCSNKPFENTPCVDTPGSGKPNSDNSDAPSGSSSPSGSSTATVETMGEAPRGNPGDVAASSRPFAVTSVGCQTPPPSILKDSRLSFSVTWASTEDDTRVDGTRTDAASVAEAGAEADAGKATRATRAGNRKEPSPREFLIRCTPGPADRLENFGKIARMAEFCQHPVLACFMYTALAVDAAVGGGKQQSPPAESASPPVHSSSSAAAAAPAAGSSVETLPVGSSPAVEPPATSSRAEPSPPVAAAVAPPAVAAVKSLPPVGSLPPVESSAAPPAVLLIAVASSLGSQAPVEPAAPAASTASSSAAAGQFSTGQGQSVEGQGQSLEGQGQSVEGQGQSLEGGSSSKGKVEDPPRASRGWGLAKGVAAVAVGIAIGAAFVSRRR